ncbi:VOC family protein [Halobellus rufus]|uniref:VOC family protein n=1 Tax=Halobellus rufus TaxID=1448860 RepID=UPI000679991F|nr:VOC family protein [Halobellus rufus]
MTDTGASASLPASTRLGRTALRVHDLGEMVDFYHAVVGLAVLDRGNDSATLGVDDTPLLELREDPDAPTRDREQAGLFHNAFRFPSRTALGAALDRIREHWTLDGASDHRVSEALYLSDPEGNGVELYRDRPREAWPTTADGGVEMPTLSLDLDDVAADSDGASLAPAGTTLGHVHLEVTSVPAAREFYVETLGFDVQMDVDSALFVSAGGYHHHIGLNAWNRRSAPAGGRGLDWFEILLPDADAVAAVAERIADVGGDVTERDAGADIVDPNGIGIRLRSA